MPLYRPIGTFLIRRYIFCPVIKGKGRGSCKSVSRLLTPSAGRLPFVNYVDISPASTGESAFAGRFLRSAQDDKSRQVILVPVRNNKNNKFIIYVFVILILPLALLVKNLKTYMFSEIKEEGVRSFVSQAVCF